MQHNHIKPTLKRIKDCWSGREKTLEEWLLWWERQREEAWRLDKVGKFAVFTAGLLQRAMPGTSFLRRRSLFLQHIKTPDDLNEQSIKRLLKQEGYRFIQDGVCVALDAARIVFNDGFRWEDYFKTALHKAPLFPECPFLKIRYVGLKTRNFALSLFLDEYIAPDRHIRRILSRLGFLKTPNMKGEEVVSAAQKLAKVLGISLMLVDRFLWHLGRTVCRKNQNCCYICPLEEICRSSRDGDPQFRNCAKFWE